MVSAPKCLNNRTKKKKNCINVNYQVDCVYQNCINVNCQADCASELY